ncbi:putative ribosomally synthesized peptide with SipW-like signal peptide [Curtobacterium sp. PhB137]|uniref:acyl-CoA dehydrogenase n=1 Tax=unclassified Curtobacterium TaxID=257496 RepID=UPI000FA5490D|nr:acyl-CoA dehydrogenase [Curtobacterium sp. PhB137]RPE76747.1 putative ribosomally synthesized peptide with SipW-like signal peptide [Curtobacterium sp. PhB137]
MADSTAPPRARNRGRRAADDTARRSRRRNRVFALAAGGVLVIGGAGYTLASWTDTEWVFGGNGSGGPGVGTSGFEVEQNVTAPFAAAGFTSDETNPGQALRFTVDALALSPGTATYAPVALRTAADSIAGDLVLRAAVPATGVTVSDADDVLWNALQVRVAAITDTTAVCDATAFDVPWTSVASGPLGTAAATIARPLAAAGGSTQVYCFEVSLPESPTLPAGTTVDALQGRTAAPAWQFAAESD